MGHRTPLGTYTNDPSVNTAELSAAKKLSLYGTTEPRYCRTRSGYWRIASEMAQKITPCFLSSSRKVVAAETEANTAPPPPPRQPLPLLDRDAELLERLEQFGVDLIEAVELGPLLGRGIETNGLIIDRAVPDVGPVRLRHLLPVAVGLEPPLDHPGRLALLLRDQPDDVLAQTGRDGFRLDVGDEAVLVGLEDLCFNTAAHLESGSPLGTTSWTGMTGLIKRILQDLLGIVNQTCSRSRRVPARSPARVARRRQIAKLAAHGSTAHSPVGRSDPAGPLRAGPERQVRRDPAARGGSAGRPACGQGEAQDGSSPGGAPDRRSGADHVCGGRQAALENDQ